MKYNGLRSVHPEAKIGKDVVIENFVTIAKDVVIGDGCWIGPQVTILDGVRIGNNCKIFPGAVVGAIPQDLKFEGETSTVEIGNNVTIREYCTLNRGTAANDKTVINDNCLLMAYVHVAHDCILGNNVIIANSVNLAGHIKIDEFARIGGMSAVQQFVKIGAHSFIGGGSMVRKSVPPYVKAAREPLSYVGVNSVGLERAGFDKKKIKSIQDVYRCLFVKGLNTSQAMKMIKKDLAKTQERDNILKFVKTAHANGGMMRGFRTLNGKNGNSPRKNK